MRGARARRPALGRQVPGGLNPVRLCRVVVGCVELFGLAELGVAEMDQCQEIWHLRAAATVVDGCRAAALTRRTRYRESGLWAQGLVVRGRFIWRNAGTMNGATVSRSMSAPTHTRAVRTPA